MLDVVVILQNTNVVPINSHLLEDPTFKAVRVILMNMVAVLTETQLQEAPDRYKISRR